VWVGTSPADVFIIPLGATCFGSGTVQCVRGQCNLPAEAVHFFAQLMFYPLPGNSNPNWETSLPLEIMSP
jgi:hypothetical protein